MTRRVREAELPSVSSAVAGACGEGVAALTRLAGYRLRAAVRGRLRRLGSPRGVISMLAIVVTVWFIARSLSGEHAFALVSGVDGLPRDNTLLSLGLLAGVLFTALTSTGPALHFSPAEMNMLFSAPLRRYMLVLYRYVSYVFGAVLSAALLATLLPSTGLDRPRTFLAILATLVFVQLASTFLSFAALLVRRRWPVLPDRRVVAIALVLVVSIAGVHLMLAGSTPRTILSGVATSSAARFVLAPFELFAGLYLPAQALTEFAWRLGLASLLLGALLALIIRLDELLRDEVSNASLAAHARWQSILANGSLWRREIGAVRSRRSPRHPAGIAPIAWSQALRMWRTASPTALCLLGFAIVGGALLGRFGSLADASALSAGLFFGFAFLLPRLSVYDFRGSPRSLELLQTLPTSSWTICLGMIATPALSALLLQWSMLAAAAPFVDPARLPWMLGAAVVLVPLALLHYALENLVFLLMPTRLVPVGRLDFDFLGRALIEFLVKSIVLLAGTAIAAGAGIECLLTWPDRPLLAVSLATLVLGLEAMFLVALLALAYRRFDCSRHSLA